MHDLDGKIALVTGAAKGVGKRIAQKLAARGAHVIINFFHSLEEAKRTRDELCATGATVEICRASVSRPEQVERMFKDVEQRHGGLDILINNAAAGAMVPNSEVTEEYFDRALGTNLKGAFWCARQAAPLMVKRGGGIIVNLSSIGSRLAVPNYTVVGTSKAALEALTRYLAAEYAPMNIRVNGASAGFVDTEVVRNFPNHAEMRDRIIDCTPMGRVATPDDLADIVMFLSSDASRWVCGQTILADGGISLGTSTFVPPKGSKERLQHEPTKPAAGAAKEVAATQAAVPSTAAMRAQLARPNEERQRPAREGHGAASRTGLVLVEGGDRPPAADAASESEVVNTEDIAIVGMGLAFPGAWDPEQYWDILMRGPELFEQVPADRWISANFSDPVLGTEDKTYALYSGFIKDPIPGEASAPAGQQLEDGSVRWLRHSLQQAMAGVRQRDTDQVSFVVGYTADGNLGLEQSHVARGLAHHFDDVLERLPGDLNEKSRLATLVKQRLLMRYPLSSRSPAAYLPHASGRKAMDGLLPASTEVLMVDTACSSSLYAIDIGVKALLMGKSDVAVCGGSFALGPLNCVLFSKLGGLAPGSTVRSLDKDSNGVLFSDGAGVVVLKRLRRAQEDGDRILGVVKACAASADGRGKAIYAPAVEGQRIALGRARAHPAYQAAEVDWILAHATGTPAGDSTELESLRTSFPTERTLYVSSNKAVIGHTGWAAGVASLIQATLAFDKNVIPPQHRFDSPPVGFPIAQSSIVIPKSPQPWARKAKPRHAGISSFGFGGTNAHLLVGEQDDTVAPTPAPARPYGERIALVAWAAHVPQLSDPQQIDRWLSGTGAGPAASFGTFYPAPAFEHVRMPPKTVRTIDRCQLMALACAQSLRERFPEFWDKTGKTTGVILGHMGKTRQAILYGHRCYLDDVYRTLAADSTIAAMPQFEPAFEKLRADIKHLVPPSNEDSFPGLMTNVIPARVASFFDLKGLTLACDAGFASALVSFELGARYLRSGELDLAIVGGINGNSGWEALDTLRGLGLQPDAVPAEGAFLFALTRESTARENALPVLAYVESVSQLSSATPATVDCGIPDAAVKHHVSYLGADAAFAILRALHGTSTTSMVRCHNGAEHGEQVLRLERPVEPATATNKSEATPALELDRTLPYWTDHPLQAVTAPMRWLPAHAVLVTDAPALVDALGTLPTDTLVLSTAPIVGQRPGWHHIDKLELASVVAALGEGRYNHLRVLTDLEASAPRESALHTPSASLMALSDLAFLALKALYERLTRPQSSFMALFLGAWHSGTLHPFAGMFSGMVKSTWLELGDTLCFGIFTSTRDVQQAAREADGESSAHRLMPVVVYEAGRRMTLRLAESPPYTAKAHPPLSSDSVIVAIGGARGITAEVLLDLARRYRPHIYIVGSNDLGLLPNDGWVQSDGAPPLSRPEFLRQRKAQDASLSIPVLNAEFERIANASAARSNLAEMERLCGAGKVHYRACDILDRERLAGAIATFLPTARPIDLLISSAGINRAASIPMKSLETLRWVRDLKILGYQNLRHALREHRIALWCNFGSLVGFAGQRGELDYAAGNDFLNTTAAYAHQRDGKRTELTIGWSVWGDVGMVKANVLIASSTKGSGNYTSMTTAEGLRHFHELLTQNSDEPCFVLVGKTERQAIIARVPGFFKPIEMPGVLQQQASLGFYLDRVLHREPDFAVFERSFSLTRDSYLREHLVNGHPTVPGTFVAEIAAQAARALVPGMKVVALEDLRFHHFLRVYGDAPADKRIEARICERDLDRVLVAVRVLTDITAPNGKILTRDKVHFEARVILMKEFPAAPVWEPWNSTGDIAVPDPYHFGQSPVQLSGTFVTTRDTRIHPMGKRAAYAWQPPDIDKVFGNFVTPCLLMDGLARVGVLQLVADDYLPVAAPASVRRIDLYQDKNDHELSNSVAAGEIQLVATPTGMLREGEEGESRCVAISPHGEMLLQMKGLVGVIVGYVHRHTGVFLTPDAMSRLLEQRTASADRRPAEDAGSDAVAPVTRARWVPMPIAPLAPALDRLANRSVLIVGGSDEMASAVAHRLRLLGAKATRFEDGLGADGQPSIKGAVDGIVDLGALGAFVETHQRPWEPALERSVRVLKEVWEPWSGETDAQRIFYMPVTALGGHMGYDSASIVSPYGGLWAGLAKSLPREIANCNVKVLDLADVAPDAVADAVAHEIGTWDLFEVGHRRERRYGLLCSIEAGGQPTLSLDARDVILVSGGGRGIGFVISEALARRFGCKVVVTGRSPEPDPAAPWLSLEEPAFRAFCNDEMRAAGVAGNVAKVKGRLDGLRSARELWNNLDRARKQGLAIEYHVCDFTDRDDVATLVRNLGPALSGVIHNAGIDTPVRLSAKSTSAFLATVRIKIDGFLNLLRALPQAKLKFFCNVGSIAGRFGGMAGQTDYAAGNEGLARLGFWAQSQVSFPVKTVCWPTWKNLGLIANFDAAVKYMSAMEVDVGVALWIEEILRGGHGEVGYPGRPGRAVSAVELKGFRLVTPDFPCFDALYSRSVYLGTVLEHRRARSMRTLVTIDPRQVPALAEFKLDGQVAVPVSLLLEYAVASGADDVVPDNWPALRLSELRNCSFDLTGLVRAQPEVVFELEREAAGRWEADRWVVDVTFARRRNQGRDAFGFLQVVFEREQGTAHRATLVENSAAGIPATVGNARGLSWSGRVFRNGRWLALPSGELWSDIGETHVLDLWATPYAPRLRLPSNLIEAALRAAAHLSAAAGAAIHFGFDRMAILPGAGTPVCVIVAGDGTSCKFTDAERRLTHTVEGLALARAADLQTKAS